MLFSDFTLLFVFSYRMTDWGTKNAEWQQVSTFRFRVAEQGLCAERAIPFALSRTPKPAMEPHPAT